MTHAMPVEPAVDREACFGFGFCVDLLPAVFAIDETGHAVVIGATADRGLLERAVADCPRSAIELVPIGEPGGS